MSPYYKLMRIMFLFLLAYYLTGISLAPGEEVFSKIEVYVSERKGDVNPLIFGNNILGHYAVTKPFNKYSDYGSGVWDPHKKDFIPDVISLAREAGVTALRFPGGCGTHKYNWKMSVGDKHPYLFGLNEFLTFCSSLHAEPIITVSYFEGSDLDAADLVKYLNTYQDRGGEWATERASSGHSVPFGVKYFEIGNEVWHGDHKNIKNVGPDEYSARYLRFYSAMKSVDPSIKIGVVLWTSEWNKIVLSNIKNNYDFVILHIYRGTDKFSLSVDPPATIYKVVLAQPNLYAASYLEDVLSIMRECGNENPNIFITEYNGWFPSDKPKQYRHCLGTALLNAEFMNVFMQPHYRIGMANYWNFVNEHWGMISNGFDGTIASLYKPYFKRPNFYVYSLYNAHFGSILLKSVVQCAGYEVSAYQSLKSLYSKIKSGTLIKRNLLKDDWKIIPVPGVTVSKFNDTVEIYFKEQQQHNYYHCVKFAYIDPRSFYKLSGYVKTSDLRDKVGVCIEIQDSRGWDQTHSAVATEKIAGTTDWQYVEVVYETLPDAKSVNVIARRIGDKGPLKGKAYFRDVKLEKFIPSIDTKIPYLSVNASKSKDENKVYLMVINKNMEASMTSTIELKDFMPASVGNAWVLNGPSVDATNEKDHDNVKVTHHSFKIAQNPFEFTFEPHSLTAIEIERANAN